MNLLSTWHPGTLILLAYYCMIFQKVEAHWYLDGRATGLLSIIVQNLDVQWHHQVAADGNRKLFFVLCGHKLLV